MNLPPKWYVEMDLQDAQNKNLLQLLGLKIQDSTKMLDTEVWEKATY